MVWEVWGTEYESGELATSDVYQSTVPNKDIILIGVRTWVVLIDDPTFTDLNMKIYSNVLNDAGLNVPGKLLHTSTDVRTKAEILTAEDHGNKEIYFNFEDVPLDANTRYNFVLNGTGYVPVLGSSFIAWRNGFPDPYYNLNFDVPLTNGNETKMPYALYFIGAEY